ncbi:hypothetical protein [Mucilaginibacter arboris]|uniref:Uncharacterized protein n=1 Tax=Mucilaginibacter arboris TaxID=2682090 RepID=A0A7K1SSU3_9SPHI|nr:hypothetical protein [Mucilaginibacter arboris]MVN20388.1 hypothetical protein [Mucilaginibacter arboris]
MMNVEFNSLKPVKNFLYILLLICASCKEPKPPQVTFDIPALIGKNIDEVRIVLGRPLENPPGPSKPQKRLFENNYDKEGQSLLIYFNPNNRKIESFHIVSSVGYDSVKTVLKIGNLDFKNTNDYWIEPGERYFTDTYNAVTIHLK